MQNIMPFSLQLSISWSQVQFRLPIFKKQSVVGFFLQKIFSKSRAEYERLTVFYDLVPRRPLRSRSRLS